MHTSILRLKSVKQRLADSDNPSDRYTLVLIHRLSFLVVIGLITMFIGIMILGATMITNLRRDNVDVPEHFVAVTTVVLFLFGLVIWVACMREFIQQPNV